MKRIIILLALSFCIGCSAQKTEPKQVIDAPLTVQTVAGDQVTLQAENGRLFIANLQEVNESWEYTFWYTIEDGTNSFKQRIIVTDFCITPKQAAKNAAEIDKKYREKAK